MPMRKKFTERQTRDFYNSDDALYRSFWDPEGNCHWGYFPTPQTTFRQSMIELNKKMLALADIDDMSTVLDLGCGNGNNSFFLYQRTGAKVLGVDLSDARIESANRTLAKSAKKLREKISFVRSSATNLPLANKRFSHVWSQAMIYHVHDKKKALKEVERVLKNGGIFIFDDLIKPNKKVSADAQKLVYDRLLFHTDFNFLSYQQTLQSLGFRILYAEDLSTHYALSYSKLANRAEELIQIGKNKEFHADYRKLIRAYRKSINLAQKGDVGWAMFVCKKV